MKVIPETRTEFDIYVFTSTNLLMHFFFSCIS